MLNDNPVVLFHSDCSDGFTAAWIARNAMQGRNPLFIPVNYGQKPPDVAFSGHAVYVLDFSYDAPTTELMAERASVLVVLDHHKTAKEALTPLIAKHRGDGRTHIVFDMDKCGARLTWEYFNSKRAREVPTLVRMVEDRDLWLWRLPFSREISAAIASYPKTFESWDYLAEVLERGKPDM